MIVGFLTDIHEDIVSLELALGVLSDAGCDRIYCLGDIVGFALPFMQYIGTRNAEACVHLVQERCAAGVAGNHDLYAARRVPEHRAGFEYGPDWYALEYEERARRARDRIWLYEDNELPPALSPASRAYLAGLGELHRTDLDGTPCLLSHFCAPDVSGSTVFFPREAFHLRSHFHLMRSQDCIIGVSGHGHPEGCLVVTQEEFRLHPFGTIPLDRDVQWIVAPCVARTSRANGCMVLDTTRRELRVLPLKAARARMA